MIQIWLARQCELIQGVDRGVVVLAARNSSPAARWPADLRAVRELTSLANAALTDRRVCTQSRAPSDDAPLGYCLLAVPFSAGPVVGVIAVEVGDAKESDLGPVVDLLRLGARWLEVLKSRPEPKGHGMMALEVAALALEQRARRIDRQLYGRSGRQGDPGGYEAVVSLEDDPVRNRFPAGILGFLSAPNRFSGLRRALTSLAQRAEEYRHARMRRSLIDMEETQEDLLAFSGPGE